MPSSKPPLANPADISSPHELTAFVETLLEQLDTKFDDMSSQIIERMMQMSQRVDALEASIQDIINGDAPSNSSSTLTPNIPSSPASNTTTLPPKRTRSGLQ
ncbi:heat shock factor binding protein 1-domain-containing protein [Russula compacta]|nr:heat shock factor binding protein 1-domain-containing protein [Russula compacta]